MKSLISLLLSLSLMAALYGAPDNGTSQDRKTAQVIITKPAADETPSVSEEPPPPLTEKVARLAAMMAVAFEHLPDASYDKDESKVVWTLRGQFKLDDVHYNRYSIFFQLEDRTYAGVDIAKHEGDQITLQGFELETPEPPIRSAKIKVVEKDQSSKSFFIFDMGEIERAAMRFVNDAPSKSK